MLDDVIRLASTLRVYMRLKYKCTEIICNMASRLCNILMDWHLLSTLRARYLFSVQASMTTNVLETGFLQAR